MTDIIFAVPGDLQSASGGYAYARKLLAGFPQQGLQVRLCALPDGFPHPDADDVAHTIHLLKQDHDALWLIDGLALGAFPLEIRQALPQSLIALIHHPLALEDGLEAKRRDALKESERAALACCRHVIVTSQATRRELISSYGVDPQRLIVAEPGTEPAPLAQGTKTPFMLLAVGSITPRKAFPLLVEALAELKDRNWLLTIVGDTQRDPEEMQKLLSVIRHYDMQDRVVLTGPLSSEGLSRIYHRADLVVSPSLYEGYGMALAEAMAHGLPLVLSTGGAAGETVPDQAGIKVPPGDVQMLRTALRLMMEDRVILEQHARASRSYGEKLPRWEETVSCVMQVLKSALS
jgi:glycosyltransferase involved in cell wall biosynthesis